jgi:menaquinone-dependent protoporphyrinogen IX oxidase
MRIAILYDTKYGNTKEIATFLREKVQAGGHHLDFCTFF